MDFLKKIGEIFSDKQQEEPEPQVEIEWTGMYRINEHGMIECRCGKMSMDMYSYQIHCETTNSRRCPFQDPLHQTGWSGRTFDFVPHVNQCQDAVLDHGKQHGIFVSMTLGENFDDNAVKNILSSIPTLAQNLREQYNEPLTSVVGIENKIWRRWDEAPPFSLRSYKEKRAADTGDDLLPAATSNLFLFVKCNRIDLCNVLTSDIIWKLEDAGMIDYSQTIGFANLPTSGFDPNMGRDLTGFVDGTRNPDHLLRAVVDQCLIFPGDQGGLHVGGSFMYAGKFIHDLRKFHAMDNDEKSSIVGRDYSQVGHHQGYDYRAENPRLDNDDYRNRGKRKEAAPNRYHTNRGHAAIYRQAMPYISGKEQGLYFIAFAKDLDEFDLVLDRMAGKFQPDGSTDALFDITKSVSNNYYYCPSLEELANLPNSVTITDPILEDDLMGSEDGPRIIFEYCTNCGYKTIALEKLKVIKRVCPDATILINPRVPRLASFEIIVEQDETILFSKLAKPDGMNNFPHCFPSNADVEIALRSYYGMEPREYTKEELQNPTWGLTDWE